MHALVAKGLSKAAIGRELGLHQATVRKFVQARSAEDLIAKTEQWKHLVDTYTGHLHRRWNEGERNATALFREIKKLGYSGGSWPSNGICDGSGMAVATPRSRARVPRPSGRSHP